MPGDLEKKGQAALQRVKQKIPNLGSLTTLIHQKSPTGNITSCALTASVLGDVIDPAWFFKSDLSIEHMTIQSKVPKPKKSGSGGMLAGLKGETGVRDAISLRQEQRVNVIQGLLDKPKLVSITLIPDHHFVVFPISDDDVLILQGFQDVYNLIEWMANANNGGVILKEAFVLSMNMLVGDSGAERVAGAKILFAYDTETRAEVGKYYADVAQISTISHKGL